LEQQQKPDKDKAIENADKKEEENSAEPEKNKDDKVNSEEQQNENLQEEEQVVFKHHASTYFYFKPEQMFYEDTTVEAAPLLHENDAEVLMKKFYKLLCTYKSFEYGFEEREKMAQFFSDKYGKEARIDLLSFYEDYYRDYKKKELEAANKIKQEQRKKAEDALKKAEDEKQKLKQPEAVNLKEDDKKLPEAIKEENALVENQDVKANEKNEEKKNEISEPKKIIAERIKLRQEMNNKWQEAFMSVCKEKVQWNDDEINIDVHLFDETNTKVPLTLFDNPKSSYAAFMMPYLKDDENGKKLLMSVVNSAFPGYGKLFSRFLHILEPELTDTIRNWNQEINSEYISAEDTDASFFNANLHPPLLPYEIWIPNGNNSLPAEKQIPITDVEVSFNESDGLLKLTHKKLNKEIRIFDLCFQGINGRSQLFQLLEKFSNSRFPSWMSLPSVINNLRPKEEIEPKKPKIWKWPRIVYENQLVIRRKSWFVSKELLPLRQPNDNNWLYFERVNLWRLENQMPAEVFIYITNRNEMEILAPSLRKNINRDDYKPQYISFENPFMVHMFEKLIEKVPYTLRIEEMLPGSEHLLKVKEQKRVMELLVQVYED
jgi:hypothetical protein